MESMTHAHKCSCGKTFHLRMLKGWVLVNGAPEEGVVYADRPACPVCNSMEIECTEDAPVKTERPKKKRA